MKKIPSLSSSTMYGRHQISSPNFHIYIIFLIIIFTENKKGSFFSSISPSPIKHFFQAIFRKKTLQRQFNGCNRRDKKIWDGGFNIKRKEFFIESLWIKFKKFKYTITIIYNQSNFPKIFLKFNFLS